MIKVAVTGASGFIGQHVLACLARYPVKTIAITRQSSLKGTVFSQVETVQLDLQNTSHCSMSALGNPDILIHLAWEGLPHYMSLHHFEEELPKHYFFLKNLAESGLTSIVVAGTCFEYGLKSGCLNEEMEVSPYTSYGLAKNMLYRQLAHLKAVHSFTLTWARLFYLLGTGQSASALLPTLQTSAERGDKFFKMSGGEQLRDYLNVQDAAQMLVALALKKKDFGVVNICSGKPISVRKLVEDFIDHHQLDIKPVLGFFDYPPYEPMAFWGDNTKLKACLRAL